MITPLSLAAGIAAPPTGAVRRCAWRWLNIGVGAQLILTPFFAKELKTVAFFFSYAGLVTLIAGRAADAPLAHVRAELWGAGARLAAFVGRRSLLVQCHEIQQANAQYYVGRARRLQIEKADQVIQN